MRLPSFKSLKTFQVGARLASFKLAAEELFLTSSAVSHQIKSLEIQLGVPLFERGVRSLTLTDAGAHYFGVGARAIAAALRPEHPAAEHAAIFRQ